MGPVAQWLAHACPPRVTACVAGRSIVTSAPASAGRSSSVKAHNATCPGPRLVSSSGRRTPRPRMATSRSPASLLVRIDARRRGGLQQQIYASVRRAILDGVVAPGTRLPSSRALAEDLGRVPHDDAARGTTARSRGLSHGAPWLGHIRGRRAPGRSPATTHTRPAPNPKHPPLSRRGAALVSAKQGAQRLGPRRGRSGSARPAWTFFRSASGARLANRRLRSVTAAQLDYGDPAGLRDLRVAIAEHVQTARGTRCGADQILVVAGAQQGLELICRVLLDPGDRVWMEDPGLPRRALRAPGGGGADRSGAGGRGRPRRRRGRAARRRCASGLRDAVAPVPAGRPDELAASPRPPRVGARGARVGDRGRLRQRVPLRRPARPVPPRPRRRRPRHLRGQLQQDALSGLASRLPHRAAGSPSPARGGARGRGPAPAGARSGRARGLHRGRPFRPPSAPDARGVPGAPGGVERGSRALLRRRRSECGRRERGCTRSPISTASTP